MYAYQSTMNTIEATKIILDLKDKDWITLRFYQGSRCPLTVHVSPMDMKILETFSGKLEYGDEYVLMEEVNASDTTEPAKAS